MFFVLPFFREKQKVKTNKMEIKTTFLLMIDI
jgi:hypothetical protein